MICVLQSDIASVSVQGFPDGVSFSKSLRKYKSKAAEIMQISLSHYSVRCSCYSEALSSIFSLSQHAAAHWPISRERYPSHRMLTQGGTVLKKKERSEGVSWLVHAG